MAKERERFEILLEETKSNFKSLLDGHAVLNNKIDHLDEKLNDKIDGLDKKLSFRIDNLDKKADYLDKKLDTVHNSLKNEIKVTAYAIKDDLTRVEKKLDAHLRQPAHQV